MRCLFVLAALGVVITYASPVTAWRSECDCSEEYEPVCGRNYRTYPNECTLGCAKELKAYDGECVRKGAFLRRQEPQPL